MQAARAFCREPEQRSRVEGGMRRTGVESSSVRSIGYDAAMRVLEIEYAGGAVYRYRSVPRRVHAELMRVESKGIYVNTVIKPRYGFERVEA